MIVPNAFGQIKCPNCGIYYTPKLTRPPGDTRPIQIIFPNASRADREQLISGIGCEACMDEFLFGETDKACTCI